MSEAEKTLVYVTLQPNSRSNASEKYRVTEWDQWLAYADEKASHYDYEEFASFGEAEARRDELNSGKGLHFKEIVNGSGTSKKARKRDL